MVNARTAALKTNDMTECSSTSRRMGWLVTLTSEVCEATAIVKAK